MPRVSRSRVIEAPPERVWALVSDPHHLPRWWPKALRVESVRNVSGGRRSQWTLVLGTRRGSGVRADYRCVDATRLERYVWRQDLEGTPFERVLRDSELEITMEPRGADATTVTLQSREKLRGLSRLGGLMMRQASRRRLAEALDGMRFALVEEPE
jgi:uncharacterized protein YndB with AHSA1/START domain